MRSTDELIENLHNLLEASQARLALTEAALTAAGELIDAIRYGITGEVTIDGIENYERMKKAFEQYETTREALNGDETK